jgi:putative pyruvate formate lyase activating enzyme
MFCNVKVNFSLFTNFFYWSIIITMRMTRRDFLKGSTVLSGSLFFPSALLTGKKEERWIPAYEKLERERKLARRIEQAYALFEKCQLCPRMCEVNRRKGEKGICRAPLKLVVFSHQPHFGEEMSVVGRNGSGTIFFSNCNLRCIFCQNWPIAHEGRGKEISDEDLAEMMLHLQKLGCHNVNLVTPTHVMPNILNATRIAFQRGLRIPLFYNTSGYERVEMLKILDGIVDIYKPDVKYMDPDKADKYSAGAKDYPEVVKRAVLEMHRQVGVHQMDRHGIATRGVMIRHLVMPNRVAGTEKFVRWVAENLPKNTYVNIMAQYRVEYKAFEHSEIARGITVQEFMEAIDWAREYGLTNLDPRSKALWDFYNQRRSG